jgi:hypothetical protein
MHRAIGLYVYVATSHTFKGLHIMTAIKTVSFIAIANALHNHVSSYDTINAEIKNLKDNEVTFGKSVKTCPHRRALLDALASAFGVKSTKTIANYATAVIAAVETGKPFSLSASKGDKAKGKSKKAPTEFAALLAKVFSHANFAAWIADMQAQYDDDQGTLEALTREYLTSEGFEITE